MSAREARLTLKKDSAMGVLHLVASAPGRLPGNHPFAPCKAYLESLAPGGTRAQRVNLERAARYLGVPSIYDFDWRHLTSADVEAVRSRLKLQGFSASTINGTLSAFKEVARRAWRLGQMTVQELEMIRDIRCVPSTHRIRRVRALSFAEIKRLFEACERAGGLAGARDACLFALLYGGGLRARECVRLDLSDYSARGHTLRVTGKGERDRTIYFRTGGARRAINEWLRRRGRAAGSFFSPVSRHGQIGRKPLSYSAIYRALERRAAQAGLVDVTPHNLRRSIGTHLLEMAKGDIDLVREYLGHVDVRTTQHYILRGDTARRRAAQKISVPYRSSTGSRKRRRKHKRWRKR